MGVGAKLKNLLRNKNMTIKQLSDISHISINTLYSITKRDSVTIRLETLQKISEALEVNISTLLGISDEFEDQTKKIASILPDNPIIEHDEKITIPLVKNVPLEEISITPDEKKLIDKYRWLDIEQKQFVATFVDFLTHIKEEKIKAAFDTTLEKREK